MLLDWWNFHWCGGPKLLIFLTLVQYWISFNFAQQSFLMEQQKKNTAAYWLMFFVSTACLIWAIAAHFEYLTLILPFVFTSFVKAMDIM
jgi:hypothetical protein